ncbi:MAG: sigma-54-dependent Fis family transcriptional regulator [Pseudomonadales bacterium]|nr:sigma-54-dependent Fis family transcriptional regulator [Pseudomonadales bacterium]
MQISTVLLIEENLQDGEKLVQQLVAKSYSIHWAVTQRDADILLKTYPMDSVIIGGLIDDDTALTLADEISSQYKHLNIVLAGHENSHLAAHQQDYLRLAKPYTAEGIRKLQASERFIAAEVLRDGVIAESTKTQELKKMAKRVAACDVSVMLMGPSGVGKEVFANYIHKQSKRCANAFIAINCAAIPENMLEAMLFGYEKGAYTGATNSHAGKFEQAQGGTLLLDEVTEMPLALQAKLLRVLQERELERLGGKKTIVLDVRVIATSNRDLQKEVNEGRFREDLFYRLNVFPLNIPSLSERQEDIVPLAEHFIQQHFNGLDAPSLSFDAKNALKAYRFPGNIRELDNLIQRALVLVIGDVITVDDLHMPVAATVTAVVTPLLSNVSNLVTLQEKRQQQDNSAHVLEDSLKEKEQQLIANALREGCGSKKRAAEYLGISPRTLRYKMARLREDGIDLNMLMRHSFSETRLES